MNRYTNKLGLTLIVKKDFYKGFWNVVYEDSGSLFAGPFKLKREAVAYLKEYAEEEGTSE